MTSEAQKRYEQLPWLGKLRLHLSRDYEGFALRARAEAAEAEVRALRDLAAVVADGFETSGATYTGPEVAMTLRSVFRAATADPNPQNENDGGTDDN